MLLVGTWQVERLDLRPLTLDDDVQVLVEKLDLLTPFWHLLAAKQTSGASDLNDFFNDHNPLDYSAELQVRSAKGVPFATSLFAFCGYDSRRRTAFFACLPVQHDREPVRAFAARILHSAEITLHGRMNMQEFVAGMRDVVYVLVPFDGEGKAALYVHAVVAHNEAEYARPLPASLKQDLLDAVYPP